MRTTAVATLIMLGCALGGCVTYATMSFESTLPESEAAAAGDAQVGDAKVYVADDFHAEFVRLYQQGNELIGYAKFTGPLKPRFAEFNAKTAAGKSGASIAMLAPPKPASLGQHHYLFTYWRPAADKPRLFGGFYDDSSPDILAIGGCEYNVVTISAVVNNSPAARMGLQAGDVIVAVDDQAVIAARHLDDLLVERAGREVAVRYIRDDASTVAIGVLGPLERPKLTVKPLPFRFGIRLSEARLPEDLSERIGRKRGIYATGIEFGSFACDARIRSGDLFLSVNGTKVSDTDDLIEQLDKVGPGVADLEVLRGGVRQVLKMDLAPRADRIQSKIQRLSIVESDLAQPAWETAQGRDFTWAAVTVIAVQSANAAYQQYVINERARIAEYNRLQAARLASRPTIIEGRNGAFQTVSATGRMITIDAATAAQLRSSPGLYVTAANRRGGGFAVYNRYGDLVSSGNASSTMRPYAVTGAVPIDMKKIWERHVQSVADRNDAMEIGRIGNPYDAFFKN